MKNLDSFILNDVPFYFRDGTSDTIILNETILCEEKDREYKFPHGNPKVVLDIGANIGATAILLTSIYKNAIVYSFEPQKDNFEILKENVKSYSNIRIYNHALGNEDGFFPLEKSDVSWNHGGFSLNRDGEGELVEVKCVSNVLDELGISKIDVIKIDCEGSEFNILTSLREDILKNIDLIVGELHSVNDFELLRVLSPYFELSFNKRLFDRNYTFMAYNKNLGKV